MSVAASAIAAEIEKDPVTYATELLEIPSEYLKIIFEKLSYTALRKFTHEKYKVCVFSICNM